MARSGSRLAFIGHYLLATVKAVGAYVMTSVRFTGCAFNRQRWIAQRIVRASLPSARSCHLTFFVLPFQIVLYLQDRQTFIRRSLLRPFSLLLPSPSHCTSLFVIDEQR